MMLINLKRRVKSLDFYLVFDFVSGKAKKEHFYYRNLIAFLQISSIFWFFFLVLLLGLKNNTFMNFLDLTALFQHIS